MDSDVTQRCCFYYDPVRNRCNCFKKALCKPVITTEDGLIGSCKCSECGDPMEPYHRFCPNCGARNEAADEREAKCRP